MPKIHQQKGKTWSAKKKYCRENIYSKYCFIFICFRLLIFILIFWLEFHLGLQKRYTVRDEPEQKPTGWVQIDGKGKAFPSFDKGCLSVRKKQIIWRLFVIIQQLSLSAYPLGDGSCRPFKGIWMPGVGLVTMWSIGSSPWAPGHCAGSMQGAHSWHSIVGAIAQKYAIARCQDPAATSLHICVCSMPGC